MLPNRKCNNVPNLSEIFYLFEEIEYFGKNEIALD
jgi:hypothetical protein